MEGSGKLNLEQMGMSILQSCQLGVPGRFKVLKRDTNDGTSIVSVSLHPGTMSRRESIASARFSATSKGVLTRSSISRMISSASGRLAGRSGSFETISSKSSSGIFIIFSVSATKASKGPTSGGEGWFGRGGVSMLGRSIPKNSSPLMLLRIASNMISSNLPIVFSIGSIIFSPTVLITAAISSTTSAGVSTSFPDLTHRPTGVSPSPGKHFFMQLFETSILTSFLETP
mmetsp:Transcript_6314/g.17627  ORF Transcript_6314/g.17627 Transcript_6314/m.17627 type:complete len:229 (+) Transcript_6314:100-786(+)